MNKREVVASSTTPVFCLLLIGACSLSPPKSNSVDTTRPASNWWQWGANAANTSSITDGPSPPLALAWEAMLVGPDTSLGPVSFGRGSLYLGSGAGTLFRLKASDGSVVWRAELGGRINGAPAVANGKVYVAMLAQSNNPNVVALDTANGQVAWERSLSFGTRASVAVAHGVVIANTDEHRVYALDQSSGATRWSAPTTPRNPGNSEPSSPAVGFGKVFVSSDNFQPDVAGLYAFDVRTGQQRWVFDPGTPTGAGAFFGRSSPVVRSDVTMGTSALVYVTADDRNLYALRVSDGSLAWRHTAQTQMAFISPSTGGDKVLIIDFNAIHALDAVSGTLRWTHQARSIVRDVVSIGGGFAYYRADDDHVHAIRLSDGIEVWDAGVPGSGSTNHPSASPTVGDGLVVVPSKGHLYAFQ